MKKINKHKVVAVFLGVTILFLTFIRENIFLEINAVMDGYSYNKAYFYFFNESITSLTPTQLSQLKWGLTVGFILFITALTLVVIRLWFNNKNYNRIILIIYCCFFIATILLTMLFWITNSFPVYYFIIRKMIGILQSPLPLFLFFTMYLYLTTANKKT